MGHGASAQQKDDSVGGGMSFFGDPLSEEDVHLMSAPERHRRITHSFHTDAQHLTSTGSDLIDDAAKSSLEGGNSVDSLVSGIDPDALDNYVQDSIDVLCSRKLTLGVSDFNYKLDVLEVSAGELRGAIQVQSDALGWKDVYAVLVGTRLYLAETEENMNAQKFTGVLPISWACAETIDIKVLDGYITKLPRIAEKMDKQGSEGRFRLFHPGGMVTVKCAGGLADSVKWLNAMQQMLMTNFTEVDLEEKARISDLLEPLIFEQKMAQFEVQEQLLTNLEATGFLDAEHDVVHPMTSTDKIKFGLLKLKVENGDDGRLLVEPAWKKFYFCLLPGHLYAFAKSSDEFATGHVYTKYCGVRRIVDEGDESGRKLILKISTPLRTFEIKMKHEFQLSEWVQAIAMAGTKSNCGLIVQQIQSELAANLETAYSSKPSLLQTDGSLPQVWLHCHNAKVHTGDDIEKFPLVIGKNVMGREPSCEVKLVGDSGVSRAHALIEIRKDGNARLLDLESAAGTFVDDYSAQISPMAGLGPGDVITCGKKCVVSIGEPNKESLVKALAAVESRKKTVAGALPALNE
jgi:hypothetical protein